MVPKRLHLQIQPARSPTLVVAKAIARLCRLSAGVRITEGEEEVRYINVDFPAQDLSKLWASVKAILAELPGLAESSIVACEGEEGWNDYLLLHHFDPTTVVDKISQ